MNATSSSRLRRRASYSEPESDNRNANLLVSMIESEIRAGASESTPRSRTCLLALCSMRHLSETSTSESETPRSSLPLGYVVEDFTGPSRLPGPL
jgi:hypothetical protein